MGPPAARAWGGRTHEIIHRHAVTRLPEPARSAWAPLAGGLVAHASDADLRKVGSRDEPGRHFIDIDVYDDPPFDDVLPDRAALERKRGREFVARWGTVPWAIEECYRELVLSLAAGDWSSAGAWAADLGHYTADSHEPLHCTKNYDGQNTCNDGIHIRFEVTMMDRHFDEATIAGEGELPSVAEGPASFCLGWIREAYAGLDAILAADRTAREVDPRFGDAYYEALWAGTREVAALQVDRAVRDLAALYLAAWEEAGRPGPPAEPPAFRAVARLPDAALAAAPPRRSPVTLPVAGIAAGVLLAALLAGNL